MDMLKLCGVSLLCALAAMLMKQIKGEYASLVRVCGTVIIFGSLSFYLYDIFSELRGLVLGDSPSVYAEVLLKALGLALLSQISADICRDMGEGAVGSGIELGGRVAILSLCIPLIGELTGYARELLGLK